MSSKLVVCCAVVETLQFFEFSKWPPPSSWIIEIAKYYRLLWQRESRHISMPNFVKIGQSVAKILRVFRFFKMAAPPSWIVEFTKFYWLTVSGGRRRIIVLNFIKIGRSIVAILRFCKFSKLAATAILDFWNREILLAIVVERVQTHQCVKFRQNRSVGCEDIEIF